MLWRKVFRAVERVVAALVLAAVHWLFGKGLLVLLGRWPSVERFASIIAAGVFMIVYFALLADILLTFVPVPPPTEPKQASDERDK